MKTNKHLFVEDDIQARDIDEDLKINIIDLKNKVKKIDFQKDRFKTIKGKYKIDRWIIQACMFLVFGYLFFTAWSYDFNMDYFSCRTDPSMDEIGCKNPFYKPVSWKNSEYLPTGEYGNKPGILFDLAWPVVIITFILGFLINHLIYNRGVIEWKKLTE